MKTNFKFFMALFAFVTIFSSCSKNDDGPVEPVQPEEKEVGITSLGFYAEDNPDILFSDYVAEDISGTTIDIVLPAEVDNSALIARFTTTPGDVVTVGSTTQNSGETVNDFSSPLEYLINEGDSNKIYTVSTSKMAAAVWSQLPSFTIDAIQAYSLAVDPTSSLPYIAYISDREESDNEKLNLISFQDGDWSHIGTADFSPARARTVDLAISDQGTPYISFGDDSTDPTQSSIMSYDNSSWSYVGGTPFSGVRSSTNAVSVGDDGAVYGFYLNDEIGSPDRRGVFAKIYQDGAWSDLPITGRSGFARVLRSKEVNGDIYLAVLDYGNLQSVSVYKYSNGVWETLADKMKESEENVIYYYDLAMDVDQEGNVYLAYAETNGPETDYQLRVKKYSAADASWSTVGSLISTSELRTFDIAVNPYGNPILLYKNDVENPVVTIFDEDTNNWGTTETLLSGEADDLKMEVAPNGIVYAAFTVDGVLYVEKYDSPDNQ